MVDAATGRQLWSERFEGVATAVAFQDESLAAKVAGACTRRSGVAPEIEARGAGLRGNFGRLRSGHAAYPKLWGEITRARQTSRSRCSISLVTAHPGYAMGRSLLAWCHATKGGLHLVVLVGSPARGWPRALARPASRLVDDGPTHDRDRSGAPASAATRIEHPRFSSARSPSRSEQAGSLGPASAGWRSSGWTLIATSKDASGATE
jgi:hypothetical protein